VSVIDTLIARLAARQHGVVARWQLIPLGIDPTAINRRLSDGRLRRVHRGVYAVGPIGRKGYWMAAVFGCGEGALLSHRDAAELWELRETARTAIDVTVPGSRRRSRPRLTIHTAAALHLSDRVEVDGIPVTSVARTLLDLAEVVSSEQLRLAYEQAEKRRILDFNALKELVRRSNGRRGLPALLALLDYDPVLATDSKSPLESMFLDLVRQAGLPLPALNVMVEGFEVDAYWPRARLVVELQSYEHHAHRQAFDRDYSKLNRLRLAGYDVLTFTYRHVRTGPEWVVAAVRAMLDRSVAEAA
jgi:hypothetical protein